MGAGSVMERPSKDRGRDRPAQRMCRVGDCAPRCADEQWRPYRPPLPYILVMLYGRAASGVHISQSTADRSANASDEGADNQRQASKCSKCRRGFARRIDSLGRRRRINRHGCKVGQGSSANSDDRQQNGRGSPCQETMGCIPKEHLVSMKTMPANAQPPGQIAAHGGRKPLGDDEPDTGADREGCGRCAHARPRRNGRETEGGSEREQRKGQGNRRNRTRGDGRPGQGRSP